MMWWIIQNGVLIDIIGAPDGGTANFAIDISAIRRKSTITSLSHYTMAFQRNGIHMQ
ncbi:MAG: hypothetical protein IPO23_08930 [Flavobacterium sp.]|nr:hypothetical protein [Flavobacterium sp.]